ncbi:EAL domain-containing protein [Vibrio atypicus]|uniref:EAL domain-containing protein n=1 Tax=Vibrio atypicus TaxID=558271 RepID=UPI003734F26A
MKVSANKELTFATKSLLAYLLIPLLIVTPVSLYLAKKGIENTLKTAGANYVDRIEDVITEIQIDTSLAMNQLSSCEAIGEKLLFASNLRELIVVRDNIAVCSSKRGKLNVDITSTLNGQPITNGVFLYDLEGDSEKRTIVVANSIQDGGKNGVFAVIDKSYLVDRILHIEDDKINHITAKFNGKIYPSTRSFDSNYVYKILKSKQYGFSLLIEVSPAYVNRTILFALSTSFPLSLLISGILFLVMRKLKQREDLGAELKNGLNRKEFFLAYQPIVNSQTHKLLGMEALIRWQHPSLGLVRPDIFISLAERQQLINDITDYVLEFAYSEISQSKNTFSTSLGINVPPSYLHEQKHLQTLVNYAEKLKLLGVTLTVEITERQILDELGRKALAFLRQQGIKISIDDFGTGHTALSVIQQTEFDYLKIDKCFVDTIGVETVNSAVLNTIIELGHRLDVQMVAEGVEELHQAQYLAQMGVHKLQGYYFSKPCSLKEIENSWL